MIIKGQSIKIGFRLENNFLLTEVWKYCIIKFNRNCLNGFAFKGIGLNLIVTGSFFMTGSRSRFGLFLGDF